MLCTPKPNGFADHYPYEKLLFHWEYTLFSDKPKWWLDGIERWLSWFTLLENSLVYARYMTLENDSSWALYGVYVRGFLTNLKLGFPTFDTISLPWFYHDSNHQSWGLNMIELPTILIELPTMFIWLSGWMIFTNLTKKKNGHLMTPPIQFAHHFERQRSLWGPGKSGGFPCNGYNML